MYYFLDETISSNKIVNTNHEIKNKNTVLNIKISVWPDCIKKSLKR